jgi:glycosyltransferase involved in cell wall biosynthesis
MRILMLSQFYPPIIGGEERHVQNLSRALVARGHDVAVGTLWHEGAVPFEEDQGVRVYRMRSSMQRMPWLFSERGRQHAPPWPDPEISRALGAIIRHERPQIVHAHNWLVHSFIPLKQKSGVKLVLTLHDNSLVCAKKSFMYQDKPCTGPAAFKCLSCSVSHYGAFKGIPTATGNRLMGVVERRAVDMFLPVSRAVAEGSNLPRLHLPYQIIPNFVPDDIGADRACDDPRLSHLPHEPYLLFVGDLSHLKGIEVLLPAYASLDHVPPLVLIGRPFADITYRLPPNTIMLHNWPHDTVMEAWRGCLFGIIPSISPEACPTVAMEAMATGRPVIASHIGGLTDLVLDNVTGILVPPDNIIALQTAITQLLTQPELRRRMGEAALHHVVAFQATSVVPRIEQIYQGLLSRT